MDYHSVYRSNADRYQQLVGAEDVDGNLPAALTAAVELENAAVVEIGAGTGRVTRLLIDAGAVVMATEPADAMITVAKRMSSPDDAVMFARAEAGTLPFPDGRFDVAIAGWVFAHQREWSPDDWRSVVAGFVEDARRVIKPTGSLILIETLGTGHEEPNPPVDLVEYYHWLETEMGFERTWFRTDYEFGSVEEAAAVTGDFFGPEFAATVTEHGWHRVPECTGIWRLGGR